MNKCNCKPKLYHWEDCANPSCHGYFYGCKEHNVRTLLGVRKHIPVLKQDWEKNICLEGDAYFKDANEIKEPKTPSLEISVSYREAIQSFNEFCKKVSEASTLTNDIKDNLKSINNKRETHQMKFIIGNRGSGVTTDILLEASKFNRPIIVPMEPDKAYIKDKCVDLGIPCPDVYTFKQVKDGILSGQKARIVHISDVNAYLKWSLKEYGFEGRIGTVSASLEAQFE